MAGLLIGDVAERAGLTAPTIRYYESIGLLAAAPRSSTGYRRYGDATVAELQFIKKAQALGFSLEEIREILTPEPSRDDAVLARARPGTPPSRRR
jgi:MerR family copper efflux transcriptional regulator